MWLLGVLLRSNTYFSLFFDGVIVYLFPYFIYLAFNDLCFDKQAKEWKFFRELRGKNVKFLNNFKTAMRMESYNQGVVIVSKPLERNILFQVLFVLPLLISV